MRVLVTGATGFIGTYVCDVLREQHITPIAFDHTGPTDFLGDVRDLVSVFEAVGICDGVIHLAAVLGTQETIRQPKPAVETNVMGSLNVFEACEHYKKKCVYIGVGNHWMNNSYSISKTTAERLAFMYNKERGTQIAVVRGLNAYGPGQKVGPVRKVIPNLIVPALRGQALMVYGDGEQIMDMIYVTDLAEILVRALTVEHGVYGSAMEAGTGRSTTVRFIAETVVSKVGRGWIEYVPMRPGEAERSVVLGNPATLEPLGFDVSRMVTLEEGIGRTIPWYEKELPNLHPGELRLAAMA